MFPPELERKAFRIDNGEFGWTRSQIPLVVDVLRSNNLAILGGELWWEREGSFSGVIPQRQGPPAVYPWATNRQSGESWPDFVQRGALDALAAVERFPGPEDLALDVTGRVLYNLTWVSEPEFAELRTKIR